MSIVFIKKYALRYRYLNAELLCDDTNTLICKRLFQKCIIRQIIPSRTPWFFTLKTLTINLYDSFVS